MKKFILTLTFLAAMLFHVHAQPVTITSVSTIPAMPSDTETIKVVVTAVFTAGGCPVINSGFYYMYDTLFLIKYYNIGSLTVICTETDTFDVGIVPCNMLVLNVKSTATGMLFGNDTFNFPLNIECIPVDVSELNNDRNVSVFPNPAGGDVYVQSHSEKTGVMKISILNLLAETVYSSSFSPAKNEKLHIDVSGFPCGMYIVRVENENGITIRRIVKE
ncbi:MAG: T9SS type A sorting domain-containing protein [Bacteroidetes bacterium]|nr:T9SS type A sorting domain-containing protein [Bacteroidota bacterium]